jgi:hypothetical protein
MRHIGCCDPYIITFDESGEMIDVEVMIRPMKLLQAVGVAMGNRIGPQLTKLKAAATRSG